MTPCATATTLVHTTGISNRFSVPVTCQENTQLVVRSASIVIINPIRAPVGPLEGDKAKFSLYDHLGGNQIRVEDQPVDTGVLGQDVLVSVDLVEVEPHEE